MRKLIQYTYLGVNGIIESPVLLEGIYSIKKILLCADSDKLLTKDGKTTFINVTVLEDEVKQWYEIDR